MAKKILKRAGACLLSVSMILTGNVGIAGVSASSGKGAAVETKTGSIVIDGNDIKADNVNGLTYKGFGMLSANSTSDLLMDYKSQNPEKYAEMMQYLFGGQYPVFTHVKLEMGNDRNNSTGSESATMRTKGEKANVLRNPGWQLAADAKKINPDLKVSILCWRTPAWVKTDEDKYTWYKQSILAAYEQYGYMVDYINPNTNEAWSSSDVDRTKNFAKWVAAENAETIPDEKERALFHQIKLVVSDEANEVSDQVAEKLKSDKDFMNAVDVVGYHYKTWDDHNGGMKWLAEEIDKEVWNSEEQATFSNSAFRPSTTDKAPTVEGTGIGGSGSALEMGNTVIKSFVESRRSHVIYQPAIGSYYEGAQYSFKELLSARDPWSGWMHYDAGLLVLAHISKFAVTGWENESNTAGIWRGVPSASKASAYQEAGSGSNAVDGRGGGENYMTLAAPDKSNFSTVIVNDSEYPMTYTLQTKNMKLNADQKLELWETRAADEGAFNENYMKCIDELSADADGVYSFEVKPNSTVTVTSLDVSDSEEHTKALPVEGERTVLDTDATGDIQDTESGYLYADDFEYTGKTVPVLDGKGGFTGGTEDYITSRGGEKGAMARYTHTLNGSFEVYKSGNGNHVLRQQLDKQSNGIGGAWNNGDPETLIGDFRWTNYTASIDALFERAADKQYAQIGIRQTGRTQNISNNSGYSLKVNDDGTWVLYRAKFGSTANKGEELATGSVDVSKVTPGTWFQLKLRGEGNVIKAYINDTLIADYEDANPITSGRVAIGCGNSYTRFDNLAVTKIKGYAPYYKEYIDNMETYDLTPEKNAKLVYNDKWSRTCANQKMYVYQRSASYSTGVGASLTYTFQGTGLELLGYNKADAAKLNVTVDGASYKQNDSLWEADNMCTAYQISGLEDTEHTVTIEVVSGGIAVDAVAVTGSVYEGEEIAIEPKSGTETGLPEDELPGSLMDNKTPATETPEPATSSDPAQSQAPSSDPAQTPASSSVPTAAPAAQPLAVPTQEPQPAQNPSVSKGSSFTIKGMVYVVTDTVAKTVALQKVSDKKCKTAVIPASVKTTAAGAVQTFRVTEVSDKVFAGCSSLTKVTIGKNVTSIGKEAFAKDKALKKIVIKSSGLKKVGKNAIKGISGKAKISCGKKNVTAYKKLFTGKTGYVKSMKIIK